MKRRASPPRRRHSARPVGYPILADPLSGVRLGPHDRAGVIDAYDPFLRDEETAESLQAELVIRVGAVPTSKPLQQFLQARPDRVQVVFDAGTPRDPSHLATSYISADAATTFVMLADRVANLSGPADRQWLAAWRAVDQTTAAAIQSALAHEECPFEGRAVAEVAALLPEGATLVVGNSMPIRDVDVFVRGDRPTAAHREQPRRQRHRRRRLERAWRRRRRGGPFVLVIGDLSFYHDLNGLLAAQAASTWTPLSSSSTTTAAASSRFFLRPSNSTRKRLKLLFGTPTGLDIGAAARLFGVSHARPEDWDAFRREICRAMRGHGLSLIELVTDRNRNVAQHRSVWAAVAEALRRDAPVGT